jgi:sugar lactone lactonase YvrE
MRRRVVSEASDQSKGRHIPPVVIGKRRGIQILSLIVNCSIIVLSALVLMIGFFLVSRMGFGSYPVPSQRIFSTEPYLLESELEIVAALPIPPGNIAVSQDGRVFFNFHPEYSPSPTKIAVLVNTTGYHPYPSAQFQTKIITCLSMRIDQLDRLWLLDFAQHGILGTPKLIAIDINTDEEVHEFSFPSTIAGFGSMLNDFQVDPSGKYIFIADTSIIAAAPALIVYSIDDRKAHRRVSNDATLLGKSYFLTVSGVQLRLGPIGVRINVDGIALSRDGQFLYYGAVTSDKLYRIPVQHLLNDVNDVVNLSTIVDVAEQRPICDGMSTDTAGNVWLTAFTESAIVFAESDPKGSVLFSTLVQSSKLLRWPDGLSFGPDGLYVTNSALHLKFSGAIQKSGPFHIVRVPLEALRSVFGPQYTLPPAGH